MGTKGVSGATIFEDCSGAKVVAFMSHKIGRLSAFFLTAYRGVTGRTVL
jgi:hypothetical protein